ncbi:MAG: phosphate butyryltransferase [Thermoanaerobacteraceae bacterium]|nr:phosphate butyryltransferase [Thermoanaerobacteraceae bacterium]
MNSFNDILEALKVSEKRIISVACAHDDDVLLAVENARRLDVADAILVGDADKIKQIADENGIDLNNYKVIDIKDKNEAAREAVRQVSGGQADMLMKGIIGTADFLKAILDKEIGLRTGRVLSHVAVFEIPGFNRLMLLTDAAMVVAPDLKTKIDIIQNAAEVARKVGIVKPKVAVLAAVEVVNPDMPATLDAAALAKMSDRGQLKDILVDGPLALDNAVSVESARHKGIVSDVAGMADILLVPDIEAGNVLYKSITYFARGMISGIVMGAKAPIILTSRSDSDEAKLNSIALATLVSLK